MYSCNSTEWLKLNVYQAISEYLKHPTDLTQKKLDLTLAKYREYYQDNRAVNDNAYDEYERLVSG